LSDEEKKDKQKKDKAKVAVWGKPKEKDKKK